MNASLVKIGTMAIRYDSVLAVSPDGLITFEGGITASTTEDNAKAIIDYIDKCNVLRCEDLKDMMKGMS